jgi:glutaredoxin
MRLWIAAALLAAMSSAAAQVYRWTDSTGKTHFTDTPPPSSAIGIQRRRGGGPADSDDSGNAPEPYALQLARKNYPVKLYSAPGCGVACDEARALLNARGVPFSEVSVSSESAIAELKELSGSASVPLLVVGSSVQKGFEQGAFHRSLDAAGYPKAGVLPRRNQAEPKLLEPSDREPAAEAASARGPYAPRFR